MTEVRALPAAELSEWLAFMKVEALPDLNVFQGAICSAVTNAMCGDETTPRDFLLVPEEVIEREKAEARKNRKPLTPEQSVGLIGRIQRGEPPCDSTSESKKAGPSSRRKTGKTSRASLAS